MPKKCPLHWDRMLSSDCTCADTPYGFAIERVRKAYHATHSPGSYGWHEDCCKEFDNLLDSIRRMEQNPSFEEQL